MEEVCISPSRQTVVLFSWKGACLFDPHWNEPREVWAVNKETGKAQAVNSMRDVRKFYFPEEDV